MSSQTIAVSPGDDLYRIAARYYGDADGWVQIAQANGLFDPLIVADAVLLLPDYNATRANGGVFA